MFGFKLRRTVNYLKLPDLRTVYFKPDPKQERIIQKMTGGGDNVEIIEQKVDNYLKTRSEYIKNLRSGVSVNPLTNQYIYGGTQIFGMTQEQQYKEIDNRVKKPEKPKGYPMFCYTSTDYIAMGCKKCLKIWEMHRSEIDRYVTEYSDIQFYCPEHATKRPVVYG